MEPSAARGESRMAKLFKTRLPAFVERLAYQSRVRDVCVFSAVLFALTVTGLLQAQVPPGEIIYTRESRFRIPFTLESNAQRIQQIQLYYSTNQGQNWQYASSITPDQRGFDFQTDRDGLYWFSPRTVDARGQVNPPLTQQLVPQIKVYVDTQPPIVNLQQAPVNNGLIGVRWDIREENLDLTNFFLEYRVPGGAGWIPLPANASNTGQYSWAPQTNGAVEVRLRVRDLAKNEAEQTITIQPGGGQGFQQGGQDFRQPVSSIDSNGGRYPTATKPEVSYVNNRQIKLNYQLAEKGPSGISKIELWATRDGRTWAKFEESTTNLESPFIYTVQDEGIYGFTLLPCSGVGFKPSEPRTGEQPQIWVEVDVTKPEITWFTVDVGQGTDLGKIFIRWKVVDKNLKRDPIKISYALDKSGPWTPITTNLGNVAQGSDASGRAALVSEGQYEWTKPESAPVKFYVRMEVEDKAHNVAVQDYPKQIIADLKIPKISVPSLSAEPATKP
jgi:hypothetical protein